MPRINELDLIRITGNGRVVKKLICRDYNLLASERSTCRGRVG